MLTTKNTIMLDEDEGDAMGATIARHFILEQRNVVAVGFFSQLLTSAGGVAPRDSPWHPKC
jgi:hypothetical protein